VIFSIALQLYAGPQPQEKSATTTASSLPGISLLQQLASVKRSDGTSSRQQARDPSSVWGVEGCTKERDRTPIDFPQQELTLNAKAAVRCCRHSKGRIECSSAGIGCPKQKTFAEAKQICESHQMRLCLKDELESNVCCGTGCMFDSFLIWTSTEFINSTATPLTPLPVAQTYEDTGEEQAATAEQEIENEEEDLKPGKAGHLGGFGRTMKAAIDEVMSPLKNEVDALETKISAIASRKHNSKAETKLRELTQEVNEVSAAMTEAQSRRKVAGGKAMEAKEAIAELKASLVSDVKNVVTTEDLEAAQVAIKAAAEKAPKDGSADAVKTAKVVGKNQKYLKQIYKDLHHFPDR